MKILILNKKSLLSLIIIMLLLIIVFFYIFYNRADETFNIDIHYKGNVDDKIVAFACNVDWGNEHIPAMLEIFENEDIKITFFVTGKWAEKNPDLLKIIYDKGHEIGNHGYNHVDYDRLSYEKNREEILKADTVIRNTLNIEPKYFAPPSGTYNDNTILAAKDLNYDIIMWSIDTIDWRQDSDSEKIKTRVLDKIHNSAIILMHPTEETVKALPDIILDLNSNEYKVGRISDIIN